MKTTIEKTPSDYITQTDIEFIVHIKDRFRVHIETLGTRDAMVPLLFSIYRESLMLLDTLTDVKITLIAEDPIDADDEDYVDQAEFQKAYLGNWNDPK